MAAKTRIISVVLAVVIVLAVLAALKTGSSRNFLTYLDSKPWIRNGERVETYPDGKLKFKQSRRGGKPDGLFTRWYPNGQKQMEINFAAGKREGRTTGWHDNGKKTFEGQFAGGRYDGKWVFYDTNETQIAELTCKNGIFWEGTDARYVNGILQISTYQDGKVVSSEKRKDN